MVMMLDLTWFLAGFLAGSLITASLAFPRVGRALARILAVTLLIGGLGLVAWASGAIFQDASLSAFAIGPILVDDSTEAFGWGIGLLGGALVTLILSFVK